VTRELVAAVVQEELDRIRQSVGDRAFAPGRYDEARALFELVALGDEFVEFLTLPAYDHID
jgi:malate synthase